MKTTTYLLSDNHWRAESYSQRMTTAQWKQVLLDENDKIIYRGTSRRLVAKKIGYGVVEISKAPPSA